MELNVVAGGSSNSRNVEYDLTPMDTKPSPSTNYANVPLGNNSDFYSPIGINKHSTQRESISIKEETTDSTIKDYIIPYNKINVKGKLGQGSFGDVFL